MRRLFGVQLRAPDVSMLRLYQPCLPTRSMKAPTGPLWIHEIKHDGFRIVARRVGGVVRLQTKQGYDYAERYPLIVEAIARLKVSSIVIDGEAMCFSPYGLAVVEKNLPHLCATKSKMDGTFLRFGNDFEGR